ncbi:MAG: NAD(P)H-binding protein [Acidiferrobacterales bacterium]
MAVVVTTPTGHIGSVVADRLLQAGADVTLIARNPAKVEHFANRGAKVRQGSMEDEAFVIGATQCAEALFWLVPPAYVEDPRAFQVGIGRVGAAAIKANRIPYVVNLSSSGAQIPEGAGVISGLYYVENVLNETATNIVHLRPGAFFENFLFSIDSIARQGRIYERVEPSLSISMVATRDIGDVAARRLLTLDWSGRQTQGVHGPTDLTLEEATTVIGEALERPISYVYLDSMQFAQVMAGMGMPRGAIDGLNEMYDGINSGLVKSAEPRSQETTTPTTLRQWAREVLKPAVEKHATVGQ